MSGRRLAALLLAGGASSRMGWPKALLDFGGEPLWRRQIDKLRALEPDELFISAPRGLTLPGGDWKILRDEKPQLGPLAGLAAAHQAMSSVWLVVLAIDMPAMTASYLSVLCQRAFTSGRGQVPTTEDYHMGLAAIYPRAALDLLASCLRSEDRSVQSFVRELVVANFVVSNPIASSNLPLFTNINHPEEYRRAVSAHDE